VGGFLLLGSLPNSNCTPGLLPIFTPTVVFWVSWAHNQVLFWVSYPSFGFRIVISLWGFDHLWAQTKILFPGFWPLWRSTGLLGVQGHNINYHSWGIFSFGKSPKLLHTVQAVSTNSWLSVAYLFSIIHGAPFDLAPANEQKPPKSTLNLGHKDGQNHPRSN
jgi:hypothetical protein